MPWRRASDRLQKNGTIGGFALLGGVLVLKLLHRWLQVEISDALVISMIASGAALIHPSWLVDAVRKPPEGPHGSQ